MTAHSIRRAVAVLAAATLSATLAATALAAEVEAAKPKPKCQGKVATIVGTRKADIIRGTARRDIIVAKGGADRIYARGGNDLICAGPGNDRVFGGPGADTIWGQLGSDTLNGNVGPDFLAGQVGNDTLVGGIGVDTCFQGTGSGPVTTCERPVPPPPPPPPGPSLIPLTGILAVAYSDLDGSHSYTVGDVMIAKLVDTSGDAQPSAGDTIEMGRYPTNLAASAFGDWIVKSHVVTSVNVSASQVKATSSAGSHFWQNSPSYQNYVETFPNSAIQDGLSGSALDTVVLNPSSPSQPPDTIPVTSDGRPGDDAVVDVVLNY